MPRYPLSLLSAAVAMLLPTGLWAQEVTLGLGTTDYAHGGTNSTAFEVAYRHRPFLQRDVVSVSWGANGSVSGEGDMFAGAGLWLRWQWGTGWFIDGSVMPGAYAKGTQGNDLGSSFEIRSLLGLGYDLGRGHAISVAAAHKSNASIADDNPGMNTYLVRYHFTF